MWFDSWEQLGELALTGILMFAVLLTSIRLVGNRALATMNASDFVITVAIGSMFATAMLSQDVTVAEGAVGIAILLLLQWATVLLSVKVPKVRRAAKGSPIVLLHEGKPLLDRLEGAQVSEAEIQQAVREEGYGGFDQIEVVVLEPDGTFSVVPRARAGDRRAIPIS